MSEMSRNPIPRRVPPKPAAAGTVPPRPAPAAPPAAVPAPTPAPAPAARPAPLPRPAGGGGDVIVARAATYYRMTRYIMVVLLFVMAGWFGYDGYKGWPAENKRIAAMSQDLEKAKRTGDKTEIDRLTKEGTALKTPHSDTDIFIQKALAFGLPLLGLALLAWTLYNSRGEYRLANGTLSAPGHPPIQLDDIEEIDNKLWERKGIALVVYKTGGIASRHVRLDDFIYQRDPIDEIHDRLQAHLGGDAAPPTAAA